MDYSAIIADFLLQKRIEDYESQIDLLESEREALILKYYPNFVEVENSVKGFPVGDPVLQEGISQDAKALEILAWAQSCSTKLVMRQDIKKLKEMHEKIGDGKSEHEKNEFLTECQRLDTERRRLEDAQRPYELALGQLQQQVANRGLGLNLRVEFGKSSSREDN